MSLTIYQTHSYMLASHVPLLKNQLLCSFLEDMDVEESKNLTRECETLEQEDQKLQSKIAEIDGEYNWKYILKESASFAAKTGIPSALLKFAYEKSEWAKIGFDGAGGVRGWEITQKEEAARVNNIGKNSIMLGVLAAVSSGLGAMGGLLLNCSAAKETARRNSQGVKVETNLRVNGDRILRLQQKIRMIEQKLLQSKDNAELNQLPIAKDYFGQKQTEIEVDKTNKIEVKVGHYYV